MPFRFLAILASFALFNLPISAEEQAVSSEDASAPFAAGERLIYTLKWGPFSVGEAILEILNENTLFGEDGYHIRFKVRTNEFADNFYKVRTSIESFPATNLERSLHYRSDQQEGKREKSFIVMMDWEANEITRVENGILREPLIPEGPMHDPLSILFYFRTIELAEGAFLPLPATDGKKLINVDASVSDKESIKVPAGRFKAYKVQPNMKDLGGVFRKSKNAALDIWFSDDERRIPVRLKSKVRVGSFKADLKKIEKFTPTPYGEEESAKILEEIKKAFDEAEKAEPATEEHNNAKVEGENSEESIKN
ncbi:MAG: DUF3108 domain-containing protein [Opitutales bacterium]